MLKKCLCALLCAALLAGCVSFCIAAKDDALPFLAATDLHYKPSPKKVPNNFPGEKYYGCVGYSVNLLAESYAVTQEFLRQAAASDAQFILLAGDLTDEGTQRQHTDMARMLSDFENRTGKKVFVICGNHDFFNKVDVAGFKETYKELGYSEALAVDEATCSYTADLSDEYRLLALDSTSHGDNEDGFTPELLQWAAEQAQQAKKDGKTLIAMMHHNFLEHIRFQAKLMPRYIVRPELEMHKRFLDWGVRYVFTGHTHSQDITSYTDQKTGRTVYDIMTTSLNSYPCAYRSAVLTGEGLDIKTHQIDGVDKADLTAGYTDELLEELQTDLNKFALGYFRIAFEKKKSDFVGEKALADTLKRFVGDKASAFLDPFFRKFMQTILLPIYEPDSQDGKCLADMARSLGLTVPASEHRTVSDLLFYFACVYYAGDEALPYSDPQIMLFMQCVYTALYETMRDVRDEARDALLADLRANFKGEALPFAVAESAKLALGTVKDDRILEMTLLMLAPLIESFSVDDEVADNDAFLPAQITVTNPVLYFLRQVFTSLYRYLKTYFAGVARILKTYPPFYRLMKAKAA